MAKCNDVIRGAIGKAKFDRIKAFARKSKMAGLSPDEVKLAIRKKFGKSIRITNSNPIIGSIISG